MYVFKPIKRYVMLSTMAPVFEHDRRVTFHLSTLAKYGITKGRIVEVEWWRNDLEGRFSPSFWYKLALENCPQYWDMESRFEWVPGYRISEAVPEESETLTHARRFNHVSR